MYATLSDLCQRFGHREIAELLCDEEALVTEELLRDAEAENDLGGYSANEQLAIVYAMARANVILDGQSDVMDSYIAARYQLPINDTAASALKEPCMALARFALADDSDNIDERIKLERDRWLKWLNQLKDDRVVLVGALKISEGGNVRGHHTAKIKSGVDFANY